MGWGSMAVFLLILKIIGILLASIIGLILFVLILIFFVPFRYKLYGRKQEDIYLLAKLTWLLYLVQLLIEYKGEGKPVIRAKIFCIPVYDNSKERKNRRSSDRKTAADSKKGSKEKKQKKTEEIREAAVADETLTTDKAVQKAETVKRQEQLDMKLPKHDTSVYDSDKESAKQTGWFARLKQKVADVLNKMKRAVTAPFRFAKKLIYQTQTIRAFLEDEDNQLGIKAAWKGTGRLLKHLGPRRASGMVAFGTGDPATTGYILAAIGFFYGRLGRHFKIQPNFEEGMFSGNLKITGRFYLIAITVIALQLWFNKNFKKLRENYDTFKRDMKQPVST